MITMLVRMNYSDILDVHLNPTKVNLTLHKVGEIFYGFVTLRKKM